MTSANNQAHAQGNADYATLRQHLSEAHDTIASLQQRIALLETLVEHAHTGRVIAVPEGSMQQQSNTALQTLIDSIQDDEASSMSEHLHQDMGEHPHSDPADEFPEQIISALVYNLPGMIYRCRSDRNWTMEFVSNGCYALTGYHVSDLIYNATVSYNDIIFPEDREHVWKEIQQALSAKRPFELTYRIQTASGKQKWVWEQGTGVYDGYGNLLSIDGFIADRTQTFRDRADLIESERRYRALAENFPKGGLFLFDKDLRYIFCNGKGFADVGLDPNALAGKTIFEVFPPDMCAIIAKHSYPVFEGISSHYEIEYKGRIYDNQALPVIREDGTIVEGIVVTQEITERKHAELALRQSEEQTRLHAQRAESLVRIATNLNAQLDLPSILQALCIETRSAVQFPIVIMCLYNTAHNTMEFAGQSGLPISHLGTFQPIPLASLDLSQPVSISDDILTDSLCVNRDYLRDLNVSSLVRALVMRSSDIIGMIVGMTTDDERVFAHDDVLLLRGIANQAAQAIANARLYEAVEQERTMLSRYVAEQTHDLRHANAELERAARAKDKFLANMSHELRTPLNTILGLSEVLIDQVYGPLNERQIRSLLSVEQAGRHLLSLINDILDLAKIDAGKIDLILEPIAIEALCIDCVQFIRQQAMKKHLDVSIELPPSLVSTRQGDHRIVLSTGPAQSTFVADERRLKQILINLLANAVKFTPDNGKIGLIVTIEEQNYVIHFTVWDTGIGIAPSDQQRLFQPFTQIDSSLSRTYEGTGLGLALVVRLTELHGGSISLESELGCGSRFTVSLPLQLGPNGPVRDDTHGHDTGTSAGVSEHQTSTRLLVSPLILLAEDNEANITTIAGYLEATGHHVMIAHNGFEVLDCVANRRPALIIMDIQMPKMDGMEAIAQIRATPDLADIPIIALTALAMPGDRERCLAAGADEYMSKPVRLKELVNRIRSLLQNTES